MKILQIVTLSELGGAQSVVVNLANELSKKHEVYVAAGDGDGKMWFNLNNNVNKIKITTLRRNLSPFYDLMTLLKLWIIRLRVKPDIIHLHSSKVGILGRLVFPRSRIVYTVHGFDSIRVAYRKYLPLEKLLERRCKAIVGVSQYDQRNILLEGFKSPISYIYNGISYPQALTNDPFIQLNSYKSKVLCIARLSPQKNCKLFLEVASLLPEYAFIWIGNQYDVGDEYTKNVFFMGNLNNAGSYCEYADLFILPSNYEGLPIVLLEAMSFGKPIVASKVGGIGEIVVDDNNGYTVENRPEVFSEKIKYILENKVVYEAFSKESLRRFESDLTNEIMTNKYLKIYYS